MQVLYLNMDMDMNFTPDEMEYHYVPSTLYSHPIEDPVIKRCTSELLKNADYAKMIQELLEFLETGNLDEEAYLHSKELAMKDPTIQIVSKQYSEALCSKYPYVMEEAECINKECVKTRFVTDHNSLVRMFEVLGLKIGKPHDICRPDQTKESVHKIVERGDSKALQKAVDFGVDKNELDEYGKTPLFTACIWGELKCAEVLLGEGADLDALDIFDNSALHYAAYIGHIDCVELLLDNGADVTLRNQDGLTPIDLALNAWHGSELVNLLELPYRFKFLHDDSILPKMGLEPITTVDIYGENYKYNVHELAAIGDFVAIYERVKSGAAHLKEKDVYGRTALVIACSLGKLRCAGFLAKAGIDVNGVDNSNNTALHYAVGFAEMECVKLLLECDADVTLRNNSNFTPIDVASFTGRSDELLRLFEEHAFRKSPKSVIGYWT